MNTQQLIQQLRVNYDLIGDANKHAYEHLLMLKSDYTHLLNEEAELFIELSTSMAELQFNSNYRGALQNSQAALAKYPESRHKNLVALHLKMIGHSYIHLGEHELAEKYLLQALDNVLPGNDDYIANRSYILYNLAMNLEVKEAEPERAIQYLSQAIELLKSDPNSKQSLRLANCLLGIGNIYNNLEDVQQALKFYFEALAIFEQGYHLSNIASGYGNIGNCYIKLKDFEQAEKYLQRALDLRLKFSTPNEISISYYNLAILYKETGDLNRAEELLVLTQKRVQDAGNKPLMDMIEEEFADLHEKKQARKAEAA